MCFKYVPFKHTRTPRCKKKIRTTVYTGEQCAMGEFQLYRVTDRLGPDKQNSRNYPRPVVGPAAEHLAGVFLLCRNFRAANTVAAPNSKHQELSTHTHTFTRPRKSFPLPLSRNRHKGIVVRPNAVPGNDAIFNPTVDRVRHCFS